MAWSSFFVCHPERRVAAEGPPEIRRTKLPRAGLFNHDRWPKSRNLQKRPRQVAEVPPTPDRLRCAKLIARRRDDSFEGWPDAEAEMNRNGSGTTEAVPKHFVFRDR